MKISSWVDFHLSNTQASVRNSTPSLIFPNQQSESPLEDTSVAYGHS